MQQAPPHSRTLQHLNCSRLSQYVPPCSMRGRRREHYQWNMDVIGVPAPEAEAELLAAIYMFFKNAGEGVHLTCCKDLQVMHSGLSCHNHFDHTLQKCSPASEHALEDLPSGCPAPQACIREVFMPLQPQPCCKSALKGPKAASTLNFAGWRSSIRHQLPFLG